MLLAIDIGNSNVVFGFFKGKMLVERRIFATKSVHSFSKLSAEVYKLPHRERIKDIIISSVVPDALKELVKVLNRVFKKDILILGQNIEAPIKNLYSKPEQVGQDRLVNAAAASCLYNRKRKSHIVVIDFGTAVTFDVVSRKDEYLGGLIFPGIRLSLENLSKRAALLPKIDIKQPKSLIGSDTKGSMRSGILYGYASLCDGVIKKIASLYKEQPIVVATGGDARLIAKYADSIKKIDPDLTLKGLRITYQKNHNNSGS